MKDWTVPIAGGLLVVIGLAFVAAHVRSWKKKQADPDLDDSEHAHLTRRFRRRTQTSGLLAVIGLLIAVGYPLPILQQQPALALLYWIGVLLLTLWIMLLAMGDYLATRVHGNAALARLRRKQAELEQQIAEIRRRGSNGRDSRG